VQADLEGHAAETRGIGRRFVDAGHAEAACVGSIAPRRHVDDVAGLQILGGGELQCGKC
jgi:hypothetical protein